MAESEPRYRFLHADGLKLALRRMPFFRASQVKPAVVSETQLIGAVNCPGFSYRMTSDKATCWESAGFRLPGLDRFAAVADLRAFSAAFII